MHPSHDCCLVPRNRATPKAVVVEENVIQGGPFLRKGVGTIIIGVVESGLTFVVFDNNAGYAVTTRNLGGRRLLVRGIWLQHVEGGGLPFLSINLPEAIGFELRVEEPPLVAVPRPGSRVDRGDQRGSEGDPPRRAPAAVAGSGAAGAQAYAVLVRVEREQVGAAVVVRRLRYDSYVRRRRRGFRGEEAEEAVPRQRSRQEKGMAWWC